MPLHEQLSTGGLRGPLDGGSDVMDEADCAAS